MKNLFYVLLLLPFSASAQGVHITAGAHWITNGEADLILNNACIINSGVFEAGKGTVLFTGDAGAFSSFIGGDRPINFYNLVVGKSLNDLQLNNDAAVTGNITMSSGNLQLNHYTLDLGSSGMIVGERSSARITGIDGGAIKRTAVLHAPQAVNPGNIGVELTSQTDMGSTVIIRGHVPQSGSSGQLGIQRYFDITPERNGGLQTNLRFFYLDGELAGKNKNDLTIFSKEGGGDWLSRGKDKADVLANWVIKNNVGELHRFTLAIPTDAKSLQKGEALQIFPNPSSGIFRTMVVSEAAKKRLFNLYDQKGHLIESKMIFCQAGVNSIEWSTGHLAAGTYYLATEGLPTATIEIIRY